MNAPTVLGMEATRWHSPCWAAAPPSKPAGVLAALRADALRRPDLLLHGIYVRPANADATAALCPLSACRLVLLPWLSIAVNQVIGGCILLIDEGLLLAHAELFSAPGSAAVVVTMVVKLELGCSLALNCCSALTLLEFWQLRALSDLGLGRVWSLSDRHPHLT